jgi:hypothetical protein
MEARGWWKGCCCGYPMQAVKNKIKGEKRKGKRENIL